jgi:bacterioferritin-associated ferredoxin
MAIIELCPECGTVACPVPAETVTNLAGHSCIADTAQKWNACTNKECQVAYFSKEQTVLAAEINVGLWYKNDSDDVPVCYCSKLTRGEIKAAVIDGCKTIGEVRELTGKKITGKCRTENPLGQCCHNVFLKTIQDAKRINVPKEDGAQ